MQVDAVAGPRRQRGEQQRGVHRAVEPGHVPTRPAEVRDVSRTSTTRRSRSGRQVRTTTSCRARRRAPVDRADVVARRRSRAASRTRCPARAPGPRTARPAGAACASRDGQVLAAARTAAATRIAHRRRATLPGGEPQRSEAAHGHAVGQPVTAPGRAQRRGVPPALARSAGRAGGAHRWRRPTAATRRAASPRTRARTVLVTSSEIDRGRAQPHLTDRSRCERRAGAGSTATSDVDAASRRRRSRPRAAPSPASAG